MRIFRPWVVASATGLAIGVTLLSFDTSEAPASHYPEFAPRAAAYDAPPFDAFPGAVVTDASPISSTTSGSEPLFAPAAPIATTTAEMTPSLGLEN